MAVTLNLQHTFTTRAVLSTQDIQDVREGFQEARGRLELMTASKDNKKAAQARAGIKRVDDALSLPDEEMCILLLREAFKNGIKEELGSSLKGLFVTRMSPVKTNVVVPHE
ncbi:hypothetical protein KJF94_16075 [Pseudomonas hormoni]|uniref:Uncharacterized protein n=1 Tax=Pseudomonas hormoni TaxID=3093767 RepID=A0ABX8EQ98_9PSED|nr:hypothetical protein [Pseudomonas hormoni]QVW21430.1 hypothetical protein KJF94_16075 [Pseudomonas hormoni]